MTLRFSERYVMGLNLLLIAVLAYFLALSVNDIILGRVAGSARPLVPSLIGAEPSAPVVHPRSFYEAISKRDIFNLVPVVEAPAAVANNLMPLPSPRASNLTPVSICRPALGLNWAPVTESVPSTGSKEVPKLT